MFVCAAQRTLSGSCVCMCSTENLVRFMCLCVQHREPCQVHVFVCAAQRTLSGSCVCVCSIENLVRFMCLYVQHREPCQVHVFVCAAQRTLSGSCVCVCSIEPCQVHVFVCAAQRTLSVGSGKLFPVTYYSILLFSGIEPIILFFYSQALNLLFSKGSPLFSNYSNLVVNTNDHFYNCTASSQIFECNL